MYRRREGCMEGNKALKKEPRAYRWKEEGMDE